MGKIVYQRTMKTTIFLIFLALSISCKRCPEITASERVEIKEVNVPGATVTIKDVKYDTLTINRVIVKKDTAERVELRLWKDMYGQLQIVCEAKDQKVKTVNKTTTKVVTHTQKEIPWWGWVSYGVLIALCIYALFRK